MTRLALILAIMLAGCATVPEPVLVTGPATVRVEVPVAVRCLAASDIPIVPAPTRVDPDTATRTQVAAATAADLTALEQYAGTADVLLRKCSQGVTP